MIASGASTGGDLLVLLAVRLAGRSSLEKIKSLVEVLGGERLSVAAAVEAEVAMGRIRVRGQERRLSLTAGGEADLRGLLGVETDRVGRAELVTSYEAFLPINRRFLSAAARRDDMARRDVMVGLVAALRPVLDALAGRLARFSRYAKRLDRAVDRSVGDPAWLESPALDSIHTVWFELHEHLLATLGRDRTQER